MNKENPNPITKFRGAWGYDVDSAQFVRELRGGAKRREIYMQDKNKESTSPGTSPNSAFKSKVNPEPDPHDMSISTLKYECDVKAYKAIEKLAVVDHDQWQYWSMQIMKDLDELISCIIELDRIHMAQDAGNYQNSSYHLSATNLIKKHNERNARWQKQWVAYKHLPEEVKETDRIWAKKAYTTMKENPK